MHPRRASPSLGEAPGKPGEASLSRASNRPWVRAALLRAGADLPWADRCVPVFARRDEVANLRLRVARLERRLDAVESASGGLAVWKR